MNFQQKPNNFIHVETKQSKKISFNKDARYLTEKKTNAYS